MIPSSSKDREYAHPSLDARALDMSAFVRSGHLESAEQIRRFELLRLAFFALKLGKLEQRSPQEQALRTSMPFAAICCATSFFSRW